MAWARDRGIVVAADECYAEFSGGEPATALASGVEGVLAVHSLSKRSNMAGFRAGFVAGDPDLVRYLGEVRKHAGLMTPAPIQAAVGRRARRRHARGRAAVALRRAARAHGVAGLAAHGLVHDGGPAPFYLWLRSEEQVDDGWELAARLAEAGTLVAPGSLYGPAAADHVRLALDPAARPPAAGAGAIGAATP